MPKKACTNRVARKAAKRATRLKGKNLAKLVELPLPLLGVIANCLVKDKNDLRSPQVIAGDLVSLSSACKAMHTGDVLKVLWEPFDEACPPAPRCPLDEEFEIIDLQQPCCSSLAAAGPTSKRDCLRSRSKRIAPKRTTWEDVSEALDQDDSMFSKDACIALVHALGVPSSPYGVHINVLKEVLLARLVPSGCTLPLQSVLHLRREACSFMSKVEAKRKYCLTEKDFWPLKRVECLPLHGRGEQFRKLDIIRAAQQRYQTMDSLQKKRDQVADKKRQMRQARYNASFRQDRLHLDELDAVMLGEEDVSEDEEGICPDCGLPWHSHY